MKAKSHPPLRWITLPIQQRDLKKNPRMKMKQFILCSLMIIATCAVFFIYAPILMAGNPPPPPQATAAE